MTLSYSRALGGAWQRMKRLLFNPWDAGRWFVLGFTAWLADFLSSAGGGNGALKWLFNDDNDRLNLSDWSYEAGDTIREIMAQAWLVGLVAVLVLVGVVVGLALLWVGSRGQFMFLDNLVHRRTEVTAPWHRYGPQGDSLFLWQIVFSIVATVVLGALALAGMLWGSALLAMDGAALPFFLITGIVVFVMIVTLLYVEFFLLHAVVPIMYRHRCGVLEGWRRFGAVFSRQPGHLVLFGLLQLGVGMVGAAVLMVAGLATCCVGLALMAIPYLGTVVILPLPVFQRYLDLEFLARLEPDWNLLAGDETTESGDLEGDGTVVRTEDLGPDAGAEQPGPQDS
ncbi:hypothetical protein DRQ50_01935 [bacterium]|nr:MAG: hypothetical protein DRQ50_01935 [bacterium]